MPVFAIFYFTTLINHSKSVVVKLNDKYGAVGVDGNDVLGGTFWLIPLISNIYLIILLFVHFYDYL